MSAARTNEQQLNPFPWYAQMREQAPVWHNPQQGMWHVFLYNDVQQVLSDYQRFSSARNGGGSSGGGEPSAHLFSSSMISSDPPRHRKLRSLTTQAFTPRAVEALEPRIRAITTELLDAARGRSHFDMIEDLAYPLPVIVIAEMLGIPSEDREQFKHWSDAIVSAANAMGTPAQYDSGNAMREMASYFVQIIEQRRRNPGTDLISALLDAQIEGEHLTMEELLGFAALLLVAGNETTTNLLGNAMLTFTETPDVWDRLRAEPTLIPRTIEEVLRFRSPVQSMFRMAAADIELHGQTIPKGASVLAWIGSANRDGAQFADPERFDIDRTTARNIAFGHGIHYCLGAPLARLEARVVLEEMVKRYTGVARADQSALEALPSMIVYGVRSLPLTVEAAS